MTVPDIALADCREQDWDTLAAFMHAFCEEDGHAHGPDNEAALRTLIDNPLYGRALLVWHGDEPVGYAVLCYGFSLEFCGRDGFLDDIYVAPAHRGLGIGRLVLERLQAVARDDGIRTLHLEVMDGNDGAARLYRRLGWHTRKSRMMTKSLVADAAT
ncbi:GNAT family N-acetyltransferase [Microbaculum marinum]|uniref:GNAT family N-acetyltransferase n=1 Tax=Microbaculum marinum TaxID=1764581 RepID=A0AAW9RQ84_9HYPH